MGLILVLTELWIIGVPVTGGPADLLRRRGLAIADANGPNGRPELDTLFLNVEPTSLLLERLLCVPSSVRYPLDWYLVLPRLILKG